MGNHLAREKQIAIIRALVEGCSIRSVERMYNVHRDTIMRLQLAVGERCRQLLDELVQNVQADAVQIDEIWSFVHKKQRRLTNKDRLMHPEYGDEYTFVALDGDTKLAICHLVGKRDGNTASAFIADLGSRLKRSEKKGEFVQIFSDGFDAYADAIENQFGTEVNYGQIVKDYVAEYPGRGRYAPPAVTKVYKETIQGRPVEGDINTSYVERSNLTMRMSMRRFTRLTNGFSKKLRNLKAAVALHFAFYNFCRVHLSLKTTPAMAAKLADHVWELEELLDWQAAQELPLAA